MESLNKKLLVYNIREEKALRIKVLCKALEIEIIEISPLQYLEPIGVLAIIPGIQPLHIPYGGSAFADEMIVFCGFTNKSLTDFLKCYRVEGISPISLKATITPHNVVWNSIQLRDELKREHDELTKKK